MRENAIEASGTYNQPVRPPQPLDCDDPDPISHQEWFRKLETATYADIYQEWTLSTLDRSVRQQMVCILTKPADQHLPYYPGEAAQEMLLMTASEHDPNGRRLRQILKDDPGRTYELIAGIETWFNYAYSQDPSETTLVKLQTAYQPLILEILPYLKSLIPNLPGIYPTINSIAFKTGCVDAEPAVQAIIDPETPFLIREKLVKDWNDQIHFGKPQAQCSRARRMLVNFIGEWAGDPNADSDLIAYSVRQLEKNSREARENEGTGDEVSRIYLNPADIARIARHLPEKNTFEEDFKYRCIRTHLLYAGTGAFRMSGAESEYRQAMDLFKWVDAHLERKKYRNWLGFSIRKPQIPEDKEILDRINELEAEHRQFQIAASKRT